MKKTKDPVNQDVVDVNDEIGFERMGYMSSQAWYDDPRQTVFTMARYKFVSKMLDGKKNVAEIGCGDGFWSRIVRQTVDKLTVTDFDPLFIEDIDKRNPDRWKINSYVYDVLSEKPMKDQYDAIYSLDVLEHIEPSKETIFIDNVLSSLDTNGVFIAGMPSLESQKYASEVSKAGHINCKTGADFKMLLEKYFTNVFLFSMNDEVVHTGFSPMAHYLLVICCNKK